MFGTLCLVFQPWRLAKLFAEHVLDKKFLIVTKEFTEFINEVCGKAH